MKKRSKLTAKLIETLHPKDTNPNGSIFGGIIMSIMDKAAGVVSGGYAKTSVVTAAANDIVFHTPIHVGEVVVATATIVSVGRTSMKVEIVVDIENLIDDTVRRGASGVYTMVSVDAEGKPLPVPPLTK